MQRLTCMALLCVALTACGGVRLGFPGVYRIDIPQGNIVTQEMIDKLQPGMTKRQVRFVMGTPLVIDTFAPDRWDYVHRYSRDGKQETEERVSLFFEQDRLTHIKGSFAPSSANDNEAAASAAPAAGGSADR